MDRLDENTYKVGKKILFIADILQNEPNSVASILKTFILGLSQEGFESIVVHNDLKRHGDYTVSIIGGYKTYIAESEKTDSIGYLMKRAVTFPYRAMRFFYRKLKGSDSVMKKRIKYNVSCFKKIMIIEKPDLIIFFTLIPEPLYADICVEGQIPYLWMLYDTFISRPKTPREKAEKCEGYVMEHSSGYYVPSFFYHQYVSIYSLSSLKKYCLPLLVDRSDVLAAYDSPSSEYEFSYFGQLQSFRNANKISRICKQIGIQIDVFTGDISKGEDCFTIHSPISDHLLNCVVAHSKFLVAFDNSEPYSHYLPSKVYLYVSFTKPIIVFGDNKSSAIRDFLSDYPLYYYQDINESTDGLVEFISKMENPVFDDLTYNRYISYLPSNALSPIINDINTVLDLQGKK